MDLIKTVSDYKVISCVEAIIDDFNNLENFTRIVWGAGVSGKSFIEMHHDLGFSYIVDTREELQKKDFMGLQIRSPECLHCEDPKKTIVFLPTVMQGELRSRLGELGFHKVVIPNQINTSGIGLSFNRCDVRDVFDWLNQKAVSYTFLKMIPESFRAVKDVDILVAKDDIETLLSCPLLKNPNQSDVVYLDVSFSAPIGINQELLLFPRMLADEFLSDGNVRYICGIRCLKKEFLLVSYVFHALIHKGSSDGLQKYEKILTALKYELGVFFDLSLSSLWEYLSHTAYFPKMDFIRKWAALNNSSFLREKCQLRSGKEPGLAAFVFRDYLRQYPEVLLEVKQLMQSEGFVEKKAFTLNEKAKVLVQENIRGGVWEDSYQSKIGGGPFLVVFYWDNGNDVRRVKERIRSLVNQRCNVEVNSVPTSDDEIEANEYLSLIENVG
jgi:hypothetical protein